METASEEEEREENGEEEEEEDPRSSDEEGGLSPVAMTTEPELIEKTTEDAEIQTASKQESPPQQQHDGKGVCARTCACVDSNYLQQYHFLHRCFTSVSSLKGNSDLMLRIKPIF